MSKSTYAQGDIIQILDKKHPWFPCLLIVGEVKSWGVQACALVPTTNDGSEPPSQAWNRLTWDKFDRVGYAVIVPGHKEEGATE